MRNGSGVLPALWRQRRWLYGLYMGTALVRIPARTNFHLAPPDCDMRVTVANAAMSLAKVPHVVLFGIFFLLTLMQFSRIDRRSLVSSLLATVALGLLVELEEGATRTGNCRLTDVLPDLLGALVVLAVVLVVTQARAYRLRRPVA